MAILNTAVSTTGTPWGFLFHKGFCGAWVHSFLGNPPANLQKVTIQSVDMEQTDPRGGCWLIKQLGGAPGHYAIEVSVNGSRAAYLDDGWAGHFENGVYIFGFNDAPPNRNVGPVGPGKP